MDFLALPPELALVPQRTLQDFLLQYSRALVDQVAPGTPDIVVESFVTAVLTAPAVAPSTHADAALAFKHDCRFSGCHIDDCQLCRNNPNKVCEANNVFDGQYWVRDDGKGGQPVKTRCGAEAGLQLQHKATGGPLALPDVVLKLYVINGQAGAPSLNEPPGALYLGDDGHALFAAEGDAVVEPDGGLLLELAGQDGGGSAVARLPELQFLNKNSKFKAGGRAFKSFKLLGRAVRVDPDTRRSQVLAQVESGSFKVTTKKGYDGCRKADYLYAHQPITDKTFASLGETTITNLKTTFEGVETVEDLMNLVKAAERDPQLQAQLRETLNMARDADKWAKLTRILTERVVWDDALQRLFVLPNAGRPLGLLFKAAKGQTDFDAPVGLLLRAPTASGQLQLVRTSDRALAGCGRHLDALKRLASSYWSYTRHPGWSLVTDAPIWEPTTAAEVNEVFGQVLGPGDPVAAAEILIATLALQQQAPLSDGLLRLSMRLSSGNVPGGSGMLLRASSSMAAAAAAAAGADPDLWRMEPGGSLGASGALLPPSMYATAGGLAGAGSGGGGVGMASSLNAASLAASGQLDQALLASLALPGGMQQQQQQAGAMMQPGVNPLMRGGSGARPASASSPFGNAGATSMHLSGRSTSNATDQTGDTGLSMGHQQQQQVAAGAMNLQAFPPGGMAACMGPLGQQQAPNGIIMAPGGPFAAMQQQPQQQMPGMPQQLLVQQQQQQPLLAQQQQQMQQQQRQQQQMQQQQMQQQAMGSRSLSLHSQLLQQALSEGWPAPQLKAVLDQMSDDELQQLVDMHAASSTPTGAAAAAAGAAAGVLAGQGGAAGLQGFGSQITMPSTTTAMAAPAAAGGGGGSTAGTAAAAAAAAADAGTTCSQPTAATSNAAAALAALFADAGGDAAGGEGADGPSGLRAMSDVQMALDQGLIASLDSFTADPAAWGDLLENLRGISSGSGNPPGSAVMRRGTHNSSMSTDWIPELLGKLSSGRSEYDAAAAAAVAAVDGAAAGGAGDAPDAAAADDGGGGGGAAAGGRKAGKRERSKTGQAPTPQQLAALQALVEQDPSALRSLSKGEGHFGSFGRHFPVARHSSQTEGGVHEGTQVANPWAPGLRLDETGVTHPVAIASPASPNPFADPQQPGIGSPMASSPPTMRRQITTGGPPAASSTPGLSRTPSHPSRVVSGSLDDAEAAAARSGSGHVATPPLAAPPCQTEAGIAAVQSVTGGLAGSGPEGSQRSGTGLRAILELMASEEGAEGAPASGGPVGTGQHAMYLASQQQEGEAATAAAVTAAASSNPFASAAVQPMPPPMQQQASQQQQPTLAQLRDNSMRDSAGRQGWISGLFRRSSSWTSSKSGSGVMASGASGSGGSHSSKEAVAVAAATAAAVAAASAPSGGTQQRAA